MARGAGMQATFPWMKCENGVVWHAEKNFHQYYFFLVWELEMIIVAILIAMKYIVNGVLQKHMVFVLFYQQSTYGHSVSGVTCCCIFFIFRVSSTASWRMCICISM